MDLPTVKPRFIYVPRFSNKPPRTMDFHDHNKLPIQTTRSHNARVHTVRFTQRLARLEMPVVVVVKAVFFPPFPLLAFLSHSTLLFPEWLAIFSLLYSQRPPPPFLPCTLLHCCGIVPLPFFPSVFLSFATSHCHSLQFCHQPVDVVASAPTFFPSASLREWHPPALVLSLLVCNRQRAHEVCSFFFFSSLHTILGWGNKKATDTTW